MGWPLVFDLTGAAHVVDALDQARNAGLGLAVVDLRPRADHQDVEDDDTVFEPGFLAQAGRLALLLAVIRSEVVPVLSAVLLFQMSVADHDRCILQRREPAEELLH